MSGPGRAFNKCPGRAGWRGSLGVAPRPANRLPPATLPTLAPAADPQAGPGRAGPQRSARAPREMMHKRFIYQKQVFLHCVGWCSIPSSDKGLLQFFFGKPMTYYFMIITHNYIVI